MLPNGSHVTVELKDKLSAAADAVAVFVVEGALDAGAAGTSLTELERAAVGRLLASGVARGKAREVQIAVAEASEEGRGAKRYRRVLVVGLGKPEKVTTETIRQAAGALARAARRARLKEIGVVLPSLSGGDAASAGHGPGAVAEAVVTGILLAAFDYEEYKGAASRKKPAAEAGDEDAAAAAEDRAFTLLGGADHQADETRRGVERGRIIAEGQNFARTIASRPGNDINPLTLAGVSEELARDVGLACRVLDEKQMKKLGMGGILGVGAGSASTPPRMIVLEHNPGPAGKGAAAKKGKRRGAAPAPLLVVGKAITFDTGGISIKAADKMGRMIFDKCGGMAVLGLMYAVAKLKLPIPVVGILSSAENHISDTAYRPGDILRMYNGVTVEVTNTDAEGRLVLGDALAWGIETYKPSAVVDLATLTGGVVVALGKTMAGVMSNSDELVKELADAGELAGEKMWRLPLGEDQREYIKSTPADIVNSGGREGHPLQGGAFLSFFIPQEGPDFVPWAHLDIAGVADSEKDLPYYAKGATGWGVRTLVEWVTGRVEPRVPHASPRAAGG